MDSFGHRLFYNYHSLVYERIRFHRHKYRPVITGDIANINFSNKSLRDVVFDRDLIVCKTNFDGADLSYATIRDVIGMEAGQLDQAVTTGLTIHQTLPTLLNLKVTHVEPINVIDDNNQIVGHITNKGRQAFEGFADWTKIADQYAKEYRTKANTVNTSNKTKACSTTSQSIKPIDDDANKLAIIGGTVGLLGAVPAYYVETKIREKRERGEPLSWTDWAKRTAAWGATIAGMGIAGHAIGKHMR